MTSDYGIHDDHLHWQRSAAVGGGRAFTAAWATRFEWSQFPGLGPGAEVFGDLNGRRLLEVGCGAGYNAAHLARLGAAVHAIDVAPANIAAATDRYGAAVGLTFVASTAEEYLRSCTATFDGVYSVFGAVSFVAPSLLLPLIHERLTSAGHLWFAVRHTSWRSEGPWPRGRAQVVRQQLPAGGLVQRYDLDHAAWERELARAGFAVEHAADIEAVNQGASGPCTLLLACRRVT